MAFAPSRAGLRPTPARKRTDAEERANEAVRVFRQMLPTLTAYARAVTGNKTMRIEIALDNGASDKNTIYFQPPIALGDKTQHVKLYCHKRNSDGMQVCPACKIRERVMAVIYHEIGHISQGTFSPYTERDIQNMMHLAEPLWGVSVPEYRVKASAHVAKLASRRDGKGDDFMNLLRGAHDWLPYIFNAVEDARVNERIFRVRPGVRAMYEAMIAQVRAEGVPTPGTDTFVKWIDCSDEFQLICALSQKLGGYDLTDMFRWNIIAVFDDIELNHILDRFDASQTARESFEQTFSIMQRFNELGFMRLPELESPLENPKVPPPPTEEEPEDEEADESGGAGDGSDDEPAESPDAPPSEEEQEASDEGQPGEGDDSGGDDDSGSGSPEGDEPVDSSVDESEAADAASSDGADDSESEGAGTSPGSDDLSDQDGSPSPAGTEGELDGSRGDESGGSDPTDAEPSEHEDGGDGSDSQDDSDTSERDRSGDGVRDQGGHDEPSDTPESDDVDPPEHVPGSEDLAEEEPSSEDDSDGDRGDGGETVDTGEAGEPIEVDIHSDPNTSREFSDPESIKVELGDQLDPDTRTASEKMVEAEAIKLAIEQGDWFETKANGVEGVTVHVPGTRDFRSGMTRAETIRGEDQVTFSLGDLRQPTQLLRLIFENNRRATMQRHLRSGKVNGKVLGKRAHLEDDRLFQKKRIPGKLDYFVTIGMDLSGSTQGRNLIIEKNAIYAQAEMLHRLGIPFVIIGHSGMVHDDNMHIYPIKSESEPWDDSIKQRLMGMRAISANLDGHALEFLRKTAERSTALHKIILYYSDGKMPAENAAEELVVLQREIAYCRKAGHTLIGVGIRTDSPSRHGLDTVRLDDISDLPKVISHLGKYLAKVSAK
jgi:hypothetical protein